MFTRGFDKIAMKVSDVENYLGTYLDKKHVPSAEKYIAKEKEERLGLRHPWLTGIPTLGIWPSISKARASEEVASKLLREDPSLRAEIYEMQDKAHRREVELMAKHIANAEANSRERMMTTGVLGGLAALDSFNKRD